MIVELEKNIKESEENALRELLANHGCKVSEVNTQQSRYFIAIGGRDCDIRAVGHSAGVSDVFRVSDSYKLVSRKWKWTPTVIDVAGVAIEEGALSLMAGPCSIESEEQVDAIVGHLAEKKVRIVRGGAFKPRTSPYAFRGLGLDGLKMLFQRARQDDIRVISEVMEIAQIEEMYDFVDIYQVGARNSQNFNLLHELGNVDKPVLIKRGPAGTIDELLQSAEYVFANGNERILLCERGVRTYEKSYRNMLDINAVPVLKAKSHLPVIVDPSHAIGIRRHVEAIALAGIMAGADGIIYETHPEPECALSDGQQTLNFEESATLIDKSRAVAELRESLR